MQNHRQNYSSIYLKIENYTRDINRVLHIFMS
jgi:hypothetical protein